MPQRATSLTRDDILRGLGCINSFLEAREVRGEICIFDGACLCLAFLARTSTKDVDAVFEPAAIIRKAAFETAGELGWNWNWLNDDVKGFLSPKIAGARERLEIPEFSHLKVYAPRPAYLLAMKILSARIGDQEEPSPDLSDAVWLCRKLQIRDRDASSRIVGDYYPDTSLPERADFFIGEVVSQLDQG